MYALLMRRHGKLLFREKECEFPGRLTDYVHSETEIDGWALKNLLSYSGWLPRGHGKTMLRYQCGPNQYQWVDFPPEFQPYDFKEKKEQHIVYIGDAPCQWGIK